MRQENAAMTMSQSILQLLIGVVEDAPDLFDEAKSMFQDISTGEGGLRKVTRAAAAFAALAGHAANAAHQVASDRAGSEPSPAPTVQPAAAAPAIGPTSPASAPAVVQPGNPQSGPVATMAGGPVSGPVGGVVTSGGTAVDAQGRPILNAADQAALAAQQGNG